jgi:hypothetical protein
MASQLVLQYMMDTQLSKKRSIVSKKTIGNNKSVPGSFCSDPKVLAAKNEQKF